MIFSFFGVNVLSLLRNFALSWACYATNSFRQHVFLAVCSNSVMKITWDENMCVHSGKCVQNLPSVFQVRDGRFVIMQNGSTRDEILKTVSQCPSKALKTED